MNSLLSGSEVYVEHVLQCDDTPEGILTAVYEAYARKCELNNTRVLTGEEVDYKLFARYEKIITDIDKCQKVVDTIRRIAGEEVYRQLCMILASADKEKGQAVFRTVVEIVRDPKDAYRVMDRLSDSYIHRAFSIFRNVNNETHSVREFLRFGELNNGVLYSRIGPVNNILGFLMPHFADRFPLENFLIYDENRKIMGVHQAKSDWYILHGVEISKDLLVVSETEEKYKELFRCFCENISIKERQNLELQRNNLPIKYRKYMVEFR